MRFSVSARLAVAAAFLNAACGGGDDTQGATPPPCGACPAGYTCGAANGMAACRAPSGVPLFTAVFVIVMENTSLASLKASGNTPYMSGLEQDWASSTDYHGVAHPSLPNYIAMTSGDTGGIACDCSPEGTACTASTCTLLSSGCGCPQTDRSNLGNQIEAAHGDWRMYGEDMGTPCNKASSGSYAVKHVPFLYYSEITDDAARCAEHVVDLSEFASDLGATPPKRLSFIAPNLVNDMHDPFPPGPTNYATGDEWLSNIVPSILDSDAFKKGGLLVVAWDEDDLSGVVNPDDAIPMYLLSPFARKGGFSSSSRVDHYALLATIEDGLGLARLGNAESATPLAEFFSAK